MVDRDRNSSWQTEGYHDLVLGKDGVGIYVDAKPSVAAVRMDIRTGSPGWKGEVYVAEKQIPDAAPGETEQWKNVGHIDADKRNTSIDLDTAGNRYRYYLVWITALPKDEERVEISEISLFKRSG